MEEFAELHSIEFKEPVACVLEQDVATESVEGDMFAVSRAECILHAKVEDLPRRRGYGACLNIDDEDYTVISWAENEGMARVALSRNSTF